MQMYKSDGSEYSLFVDPNMFYIDSCLEMLQLALERSNKTVVIDYSLESASEVWGSFPSDSVLFLLGDEGCKKSITTYEDRFMVVFTNYFKSRTDGINFVSLPLGIRCDTIGEFVTFQDRLYDLSFSGFVNDNRIPMVASLASIPTPLLVAGCYFGRARLVNLLCRYITLVCRKTSITPTSSFGQGLSSTGYDYLLRQSKISLCPPGFINSETYRYAESMQRGCITVTGSLPQRAYYQTSPAIVLEDFNNTRELVTFLRKYLITSQGLSVSSLEHYQRDLAPEVTSSLIAKSIGL